MLTDADKLLIAAAVDGPLPSDQSGVLARLLAGSAEARALAARLAADRRDLAGLARLTAPVGFAAGVYASLPIIRLTVPLPSPRRATWLPYVTAAGVFVAVAVGAYQLTGPRGGQREPVAVTPPKRPVRPPVPQDGKPELLPMPQPVEIASPVVVERVEPTRPELAPAPRAAGEPTLLAAGLFREIESPAEVTARLPLLGPVADLDTADAKSRVTATWGTLASARIDLFTADPTAALPSIQAAAKACGWVVSVDATAQTLVKGKQPGNFALYSDAVSAEEGGRFLSALATEQRKGAKLGFAHLSATPASDQRELKELLGGDPKPHARPEKDDSTIGQVVRQLTPRRPALLFAVSPVTARPIAGSKEVRALAESRTERKPGSIPLLVVIRPLDGN